MREIKFKVFDSYKSEWLEDFVFLPNGEILGMDKRMNVIFLVSIGADRRYKKCQYTGLKDKNGKEIYEGDILKLYIPNWADCDDVQRFVINEYCPDVSYLQAVVKHCEECLLDGENDYIEVIGNIYETGGITQ